MSRRSPLVAFCVAGLVLLGACNDGAAALPALPGVVGMPLDRAKNTVRDAGWTDVESHDVLESRRQFADGNWQVCTQSPAAGPAAAGTQVDLGVVRTEETCPGTATTTPVPTTTLPPTSTEAPLPTLEPDPIPDLPTRSPDSDPGSGDSGDSGGSGGGGAVTVNPGAYCSNPGATGVTKKGTPMVCGPGSDGQDRWHSS